MTEKTVTLPHAPGNLKYTKPCGAKGKRSGLPCQGPAMPNGRCRLHGGKSTGAKTPEGLERIRQAKWKHGERSKAALEEIRDVRKALKMLKLEKKGEPVDIEFLGIRHSELLETVSRLKFTSL